MTATTVMLVDDHLVVRAGLRALLDSQPDIEVIGEADSGEQAVDMAVELGPRLVMMDLALGAGIDGVEAIRRIRAACPTLPVLVFTTYDTDADVVRAIDAGAIG
jgi:DNA-binding NarL/FixJ family response regulator